MSRIRCALEFVAPDGVSREEIEGYIIDELQSSGGNRHPSDPLFGSLAEVRVVWPRPRARDTRR